MSKTKSIVVLGPTASGKSDVAMSAATSLSGGSVHIIAADAMQVYKRMNIGTAKPTEQDQTHVMHHGINVCEPSERYTVARYMEDIAIARLEIVKAGASELIVGGTGLYVTAIVDGLHMPGEWPEIRKELEENQDTQELFAELTALDPVSTLKMEPNNRRRIVRALEVCRGAGVPFSSFGDGLDKYKDTATKLVGIRWDRDALRIRIKERVHVMVKNGLLDEVRALIAEPQGLSPTAAQALGYKEMIEHLEGRVALSDAVASTVLRTQQFAVRQERWYRRDPRIEWVDVSADPVAEIVPLIVKHLE